MTKTDERVAEIIKGLDTPLEEIDPFEALIQARHAQHIERLDILTTAINSLTAAIQSASKLARRGL